MKTLILVIEVGKEEDNMSKNTNRANATEINKCPRKLRYVFIIQDSIGNIALNSTYRSLKDRINPYTKSVRVVDLRDNTVAGLRVDLIDKFMYEWRENYFDPSWAIPTQFTTG